MANSSPSLKQTQVWISVLLAVFLFTGTLLLASCDLLGPRQALPSSPQALQARQLYHNVWLLVKQEFVDPSTNGQDWQRWEHMYDTQLHTLDDAYVAIETMLASLNDPYSRFLTPHDANDQDMHIDAKLFGVGIQIAQRDTHIVIIAPIEGSPAARAGLRPLDEVVKVNNIPVVNLSMDDVANRIRGPKGTSVQLTLKRGKTVMTQSIVRDEIILKSVYGKALTPDIGYIRIASFIGQDTANEFRRELLKHQHDKGLIMDLRGNNGGLLTNAVDVSDMLLDKGVIVSIVDRGRYKEVINAQPGALFDKPMVVLVDEGSASASEIVSAALQENDRAKLIGTKTFGKGLVQKIYNVNEGAEVNLTISKYLTPQGHNIDKRGIQADIKVPFSLEDLKHNRDPQKDKALSVLKSML